MTTIEELKKQFKVANVLGRGQCIIIPLNKFDPDWDQMILDAGLSSHAAEDVVYVILGPESAVEKEVRHPVPPSKTWKKWTDEEDKLLIKLWNQEPRLKRDEVIKRVREKYPSRTGAGIKNRLARLRKAGKIRGRWEKSPPQPIETETPYPTANFFLAISKIIDILHAHTQVLDKLGCEALMHALEIKQLKGDLTIPPKLLIHYANALLEDDQKFRDVFRSKVKLLLEASK